MCYLNTLSVAMIRIFFTCSDCVSVTIGGSKFTLSTEKKGKSSITNPDLKLSLSFLTSVFSLGYPYSILSFSNYFWKIHSFITPKLFLQLHDIYAILVNLLCISDLVLGFCLADLEDILLGTSVICKAIS